MHALRTHSELLSRLQLEASELRRIVEESESFYSARTIKRRSRSRPRTVYVVGDSLRRIHRIVAILLAEDVKKMAPCVTGFRRKSSIARHAEPHCGAETVVVADVKAFFASITDDLVWELLMGLGVAPNVAMTLTRLVTLRGSLPEGSRCSPSIANLVGARIDTIVLERLRPGCVYTRYVDDLAFSGEGYPGESEIAEWLKVAGFELKPKSYKLKHRSQGPYITGLFVGGATPKIPRKRRRMIERTLHYLGIGDPDHALKRMCPGRRWQGLTRDQRLASLKAHINGIAAIEPVLGNEYRIRLAGILENE